MKRSLRAILISGEEDRDAVLQNRKKITIREGHRDYSIGPVLLGCHKLNWATLKNITSVRHTTLEEVTEREWLDDGYKSQDDMYNGLRIFYHNLEYLSPVTVIRWDDLKMTKEMEDLIKEFRDGIDKLMYNFRYEINKVLAEIRDIDYQLDKSSGRLN